MPTKLLVGLSFVTHLWYDVRSEEDRVCRINIHLMCLECVVTLCFNLRTPSVGRKEYLPSTAMCTIYRDTWRSKFYT
ncbi:hypothetical protein BGZ60DRAFT_410125 [Tricladium varicosporioides]|nr:hypothetical protein BGZ60DRAFT_410125 [Hymenoscyphus varicosporioides]